MATYLYGVVRRPERKRLDRAGVGNPPSALRLVEHRNISALVSDTGGPEQESEGRALRRDLRAHEEVVRKAMEMGPVLPVSFGTIFEDDEQLVQNFLRPNLAELERLLDDFDGLVEVTFKAEFVEESVIQRLLDRDVELRAWRDSARYSGPDEQIAFGRALAIAIEEEGAIVADSLMARLTPLARDSRFGSPGHGVAVLKGSFLVEERQLGKFDAAVEALAKERAGLVEFDYVGPLPPYSFINLDLADPAV